MMSRLQPIVPHSSAAGEFPEEHVHHHQQRYCWRVGTQDEVHYCQSDKCNHVGKELQA